MYLCLCLWGWSPGVLRLAGVVAGPANQREPPFQGNSCSFIQHLQRSSAFLGRAFLFQCHQEKEKKIPPNPIVTSFLFQCSMPFVNKHIVLLYASICLLFLSKNEQHRRKKELAMGWRQFIFISLHLVERQRVVCVGGCLGSIITDSVAMETDWLLRSWIHAEHLLPDPQSNTISSLSFLLLLFDCESACLHLLLCIQVLTRNAMQPPHFAHRAWTLGVLTSLPRKHESASSRRSTLIPTQDGNKQIASS